ncbi:MAG: LamG domain-containing protein [Chloroflexi bacterium]|nr:LamG domain-containing protein [Chloroflexota bacterium]
MAVRFSPSNYLSLTANVGNVISTVSFGGWFKRKVDTGNWATMAYWSNNGSGAEYFIETDSGGDTANYYDLVGGDETNGTGPTMTVDVWFFFMATRSNSGLTFYWGTEAGGTLNTATASHSHTPSTSTDKRWFIGNDVYSDFFNGEGAYVGFWNKTFDATEVDAQYRSTTPVNTADLVAFYALAAAASAGTDSSGNGLNMSVTGTLSDGGSNPVPPVAVTVTQSAYRFRDDDGSESTATWRQSENTVDTAAPEDAFRLRLQVDADGDPASQDLQLEYSVQGSGVWQKAVTAQPPATAPTFQALGTEVSGIGNVTPTWPTHEVDDIALLFIESCGGEAASLGTASGFVAVTNSPSSTGTTTNGTRLSVYWCRATSTSMAAPVVTDPGNHAYARIITFRGCIKTGDPWDVTAASQKASASTSSTLPAVTTTIDQCLIVLAAARDNDSASAAWSAQSNGNLSSLTERSDSGTTQGNGGGIAVVTGVMATAGSTGTTSATVTSSINAYLTIALKPEPPPTELFLLSASANIAGSAATATTAQLTAPSGKSGDFTAGAISDDTNPISVDIAADFYTEVEFSLVSIAAIPEDDYDFRLTAAGVALDAYSQTPTITIAASGDQNAGVNTSAVTIAAYNLTASPGAVNAPVGTTDVAIAAYAVIAHQTVGVGVAAVTVNAYDPTASPGGVNAAVNVSAVTITAYDPTASPGGINAAVDTTNVSISAYDTATSVGAVTASVDSTDIGVAAFDVATTVGGVNTAVDSAGVSITANNPTAAPGAISADVDVTGVSITAYDTDSVLGGSVASVDTAAVTVAAYDSSATPGGVNVGVNVSAVTIAGYDATSQAGAVNAAVGFAAVEIAAYDLSALLGGTTASVNAAAVTISAYDVTAQPGGINAAVDVAAVVTAAYNVGASPGGVSIGVGYAVVLIAAYDAADAGISQTVSIDRAMVLVTVYPADLPRASDEDTYTVPAEQRFYIVPAENRYYAVPAEDRYFAA